MKKIYNPACTNIVEEISNQPHFHKHGAIYKHLGQDSDVSWYPEIVAKNMKAEKVVVVRESREYLMVV